MADVMKILNYVAGFTMGQLVLAYKLTGPVAITEVTVALVTVALLLNACVLFDVVHGWMKNE
jgi:hypothetical protein